MALKRITLQSSSSTFSPISVGDCIGHFRILRVLYLGNMNVVYLVSEEGTSQLYVLKHAIHKRFYERLRVEMKHLMTLRTLPFIASLYVSGEDLRFGPYFVQAYRGDSLSSLIKEGRLSCRERFDLAMQICAVLESLHTLGWLLRDLKPANIVVHPHTHHVNFVDLGSWMRLEDYKVLSLKGAVDATLQYAAPEQLSPKGYTEARTQRIDIHALGATLYELFVGRHAFEGDSEYEIMLRHIREELPSVESPFFSPDTNQLLEKILHLCLQKQPSRRFTNVGAVGNALRVLREYHSMDYGL